MKLLRIDHVCLQVSDLQASTAYYQDLLRVNLLRHPTNPKMFALERGPVHFFLEESDVQKAFLSKQHLSFAVEDLSEIKQRLTEKDIAYEEGTTKLFQRGAYQWVEWRDPDGVRVECVVYE